MSFSPNCEVLIHFCEEENDIGHFLWKVFQRVGNSKGETTGILQRFLILNKVKHNLFKNYIKLIVLNEQ